MLWYHLIEFPCNTGMNGVTCLTRASTSFFSNGSFRSSSLRVSDDSMASSPPRMSENLEMTRSVMNWFAFSSRLASYSASTLSII